MKRSTATKSALLFAGLVILAIAGGISAHGNKQTRTTTNSCASVDFPIRDLSMIELHRQAKRLACAAHPY